jgi:gluconate 5-dehydrogenase
MVANIRDNKAVDAVLEKIEEKTGRLVGWINNAYEGHSGLLLDASEKDMLDSVEFGLVRVMGITQRVAKRMIAGGGGSIINISTMYGMVSPQPDTYLNFPKFHNPPAYGAAKAGLIQYTRYAACHLAKQGIRVNAISPGPFPHGEPAQEQGFIEELCRRVPMGRVGKPEDVAGAAVFLISNASAYITGQNLAIDGGWTAW